MLCSQENFRRGFPRRRMRRRQLASRPGWAPGGKPSAGSEIGGFPKPSVRDGAGACRGRDVSARLPIGGFQQRSSKNVSTHFVFQKEKCSHF
jgi:hypothetical protein